MTVANKSWHFLISVIFCGQLIAQTVDPILKPDSLESSGDVKSEEFVLQKEQMEEKKKSLVAKLRDLRVNEFTSYINELKNLRDETQIFIDYKKKECLGEFASVVYNDLGESELVKRKLTKEEKKICLHDLKTFNAFYIGKVFDSKKDYLKKVFQKQIQSIEEAKDELLEDMESRFKEIEQQQTGRKSNRKT